MEKKLVVKHAVFDVKTHFSILQQNKTHQKPFAVFISIMTLIGNIKHFIDSVFVCYLNLKNSIRTSLVE